MTLRQFRFGVCIRGVESATNLREVAKRYEGLGFETVSIPDHLSAVAPFPMLAALTQASPTLRIGTYVLNAGFYKSALLARDVAALDLLSTGRLELGLGAGYVREEFEAAEIPFLSARRRIDHLEQVTAHLKRHHPAVSLMIAGDGDRVLRLGARHANVVGLAGGRGRAGESDPLAARVAFIQEEAGSRFADIELNLMISAAPTDSSVKPDLSFPRRHAHDLTDEQIMSFPGVMSGTPRDIADTLRDYRDRCGVTYFTVLEPYADYIAKAIGELR
ncbi:luciferase [Mycobacterium sp. Root135]|nr:luciferase [Mycobacterium sp. Root135]